MIRWHIHKKIAYWNHKYNSSELLPDFRYMEQVNEAMDIMLKTENENNYLMYTLIDEDKPLWKINQRKKVAKQKFKAEALKTLEFGEH